MSGRLVAPDIVEFTTDPQLLGLSISPAQETLLRAIYGLPLPKRDHVDVWRQATGGRPYREGHRFPEVTVISGARGGKDSRIVAPCLTYEAIFGGHERSLSRGERATIPLVSQDARANAVARGYVFDYLQESRLLASRVDAVRRDQLDLINRTSVVCFPNLSAAFRAWSIPAGGMSEIGSWRVDGRVDADVEIQASIRRGMISFPRTLLLKASTPYMRSGLLFSDFERAFGQDDPDLLVWRASSTVMNPSLRAERLAQEQRLDPLRYRREYEAEWTDDVSAFLDPAAITACVDDGVRERAPVEGVSYQGFCDPSGGRRDAFTLAVAHKDDNRIVVDLVRAWPAPFNPSNVIAEAAELLRTYHLGVVEGDRYAGEFPREAFRAELVDYEVADRDRSALYLDLLPRLNAGSVALLDDPALLRELRGLERRRGASGRDRIDHAPGGHDDRANAVAGVVARIARASRTVPLAFAGPGHSERFDAIYADELRKIREARA